MTESHADMKILVDGERESSSLSPMNERGNDDETPYVRTTVKPMAASSANIVIKHGKAYRWHPGYAGGVPESYYPAPECEGAIETILQGAVQ